MPPRSKKNEPVEPLWQRARREARDEIFAVAMDLFAEQGFDGTTVEQIAGAAGISRRSFFRYFGTKEDIILGDLSAYGPQLLACLQARPRTENVWDSIAATFQVLHDALTPAQGLLVARLIAESPSLRARHLQKHLNWQEALAPEVEQRLEGTSSPDHIRGRAVVGAALVSLDVAMQAWLANDGAGGIAALDALYAQSVAAVRA